jgi:2TM domain
MITVAIDEGSPSSPATAAGAIEVEPDAGGKEPAADPPERRQGPRRLDDRHSLWTHVFAYLLTNAFAVGVWLATGAGYFWPGYLLVGWGAAVALRGSDYYWRWHNHGKLISTPR